MSYGPPAFPLPEPHQDLRDALVGTILDKGISDPQVLAAVGRVPRHRFAPAGIQPSEAYADCALAIGEGQTISQPYTVAYQTQLLGLAAGQVVLEVGTGSGYQAAVLRQWPVVVYTIECNAVLHKRAKKLLADLNLADVHCLYGDGSQGWLANAPYDRIIVTAGAPAVPGVLLQQLKVGGRLVIPVGQAKSQQMVRVLRHSHEQFETEAFDLFSFVPLLGKYGRK